MDRTVPNAVAGERKDGRLGQQTSTMGIGRKYHTEELLIAACLAYVL
jgi:hypothetical protein